MIEIITRVTLKRHYDIDGWTDGYSSASFHLALRSVICVDAITKLSIPLE